MDEMCFLQSLKLFFLNKHQRLLDHAVIGPDRKINDLEKKFKLFREKIQFLWE